MSKNEGGQPDRRPDPHLHNLTHELHAATSEQTGSSNGHSSHRATGRDVLVVDSYRDARNGWVVNTSKASVPGIRLVAAVTLAVACAHAPPPAVEPPTPVAPPRAQLRSESPETPEVEAAPALRPKLRIAVLFFDEVSPTTSGRGAHAPEPLINDAERSENAFMKAWGDGDEFIDVRSLAESAGGAVPSDVAEGGRRLRELASRSGASLMIVGTSSSAVEGVLGGSIMDSDSSPRMMSCSAIVSARVIQVDQGIVLAAANSSKRAMHLTPALCRYNSVRAAMEIAAKELRKDVEEKLQSTATGNQ